MGFFEAVASVFSKYFQFSGRALRSEYWYFSLFTFLVYVATGTLDTILFNSFMGNGPISLIVTLVFFFPTISVLTRRLHDSGRSGWWQLLSLTIIGIPVILYWVIKKGDTFDNRFGMPPIGSRSNNSAAARATRPGEASSSTDSSRGESSTASRAAREASSSTDSPRRESSAVSRAAREASSSTDSSRGEEVSSTKPADLYFDNRKSPPKEPVKKQEKPLKDTSSEIDDIFFDNRRKK
jgi:uncharacterized membrane protein YhaH (DUF805 family)